MLTVVGISTSFVVFGATHTHTTTTTIITTLTTHNTHMNIMCTDYVCTQKLNDSCCRQYTRIPNSSASIRFSLALCNNSLQCSLCALC